ncbi:LLM class F420-dependent oxidoreductase [Streptomyces decoyicus]|uniref:LLM class F420-dependent oxidoreductase n=2 Tax=Streptomyces decoyicus TaxID=249567 RepID=UPI0033B39A04
MTEDQLKRTRQTQQTDQPQKARAQEFGTIGIWSGARGALRSEDPGRATEIAEAAAELDELGYGTIWLGGKPGVAHAVPLLKATRRIRVATGILSIWEHEPAAVAGQFVAVNTEYDNRFLLGVGVSHPHLAAQYSRPYSAIKEFLTGLDEAPVPVPAERRVLAALGPKMLELSRDRAAGAHPYLVTVEHTGRARAILGDRAWLAPEHKAVLDTDLDRGRQTARDYLAVYLPMPNYTNNLRRLGFADEDFEGGGSDRLIDALFSIGDVDAVRKRTDEFLSAGADHLALQVVTADPLGAIPRREWRLLAEALPLDGR